MSNRQILTIAAIILTLLVWAAIIWSINKSLNLGMGVGYELLVAAVIVGLLMLLFPVILIVPVYKCSTLFTLGVIWSITTFAYLMLPLKTYIDFKECQMIQDVSIELTEKIDDPATSWEAFKAIADKAEQKTEQTKFTIMEQLLNRRRFDLAAKMVEEGFDMRTFNMAGFLYRCLYLERSQRQYGEESPVEAVKFMVDNGCNINATFEGDNSLNLTIRYNDTVSAYFLLERGVNFTPRPGASSPLAVAAGVDNRRMVQTLLDKGADINHKDIYMNTPLNDAALIGSSEMIEFLLLHGAEINSVNLNGESSLFGAVSSGNIEAVRILLKYGAQVNYLDRNGYDALHRTYGREPLVRILVEAGAVVSRTYPGGKTILDVVDKEEKPELWQYLYDRGARVGVKKE